MQLTIKEGACPMCGCEVFQRRYQSEVAFTFDLHTEDFECHGSEAPAGSPLMCAACEALIDEQRSIHVGQPVLGITTSTELLAKLAQLLLDTHELIQGLIGSEASELLVQIAELAPQLYRLTLTLEP